MLTIPADSLLFGLQSFGLAFALSALLYAPILSLLGKMKAKQSIHSHAPETHKAKEGTPNLGGLIVLAGLIPALIVNAMAFGEAVYYIAAMVAGFALIGFIDDYVVPRKSGKRGLSWGPKLVLQAAAASMAPIALAYPLEPLTWAITIIVVLFFVNAYNFADGLDGLAGSLGVLLSLGFGALLLITMPTANIGPFLAVAGALVPFLFVNAHPAKVFMGDIGSLPIGSMVGLMAMGCLRDPIFAMASPLNAAAEMHPPTMVEPGAIWLPVLVISLVMIAELLPVPMQVAYFKMTKGKRLFPMTPIHHAFEKKGWPETRVVWSFALVQLLLVIAAIYLLVRSIPIPQPTAG